MNRIQNYLRSRTAVVSCRALQNQSTLEALQLEIDLLSEESTRSLNSILEPERELSQRSFFFTGKVGTQGVKGKPGNQGARGEEGGHGLSCAMFVSDDEKLVRGDCVYLCQDGHISKVSQKKDLGTFLGIVQKETEKGEVMVRICPSFDYSYTNLEAGKGYFLSEKGILNTEGKGILIGKAVYEDLLFFVG